MNDATIAVSDDVRASIAPALQPRVEVVTHGVDLSRVRATRADRQAVRAELGVEPGEVLAVTVANLRTQKNYPGLFAAAQAHARPRRPRAVRGRGAGAARGRGARRNTRRGGSAIGSRSSDTATTRPGSSAAPTCSCSRHITKVFP